MIVRNNNYNRNRNHNTVDLTFYKKYGFNKYDKYTIENGIIKYDLNDDVVYSPIKYFHNSRYNKVNTLKELGKSYHVINKYVKCPSTNFTTFKVTNEYVNRLDKIALKFYNDETYWWLIGYFNNIYDCLNIPLNSILFIPNLSILGDISR